MPTTEQIRELRKSHGYTQKQAADLLLVTLNGYQNWEAGRRKISPTAWKLMQLLMPIS